MKVLFLHDLMTVKSLRRQTVNQCFFFLKYRPETEAVLHAVGDPVSEAITACDFDAIFLDASFLCWRWAKPASVSEWFRRSYAWLATHPAVKLAFPQDDYDHQAVLDEWLSGWSVDVVFSPLPGFASLLYPALSRTGEIRPFLTGFVDDVDLAVAERVRLPIAQRPIDIAYRARPLPANFGELGLLKTRIAEMVAPAARAAGLACDISTDPADTIFGDDWLTFLGSSRYVLGTPSGSSVIDSHGEIGAAVAAYAQVHPDASFAEISAACVPSEAALHRMEALSPRVFETALTGACQILVRGEYGPLEPDRHYIPIEPDFSNVEAVIAGLGDHDRAQRIADDCLALVTGEQDLHYRSAADAVERAIIKRRAVLTGTEPAPRERALRDMSAAELVERSVRSDLAARQQLLRGLSEQVAAATSGDPVHVNRFSDLATVVADRWGRLNRHAADETSRVVAAQAELANLHVQMDGELAELRARTAYAEAQLAELRDASLVRLSRMMAKRVLTRMGLR
jgi:hypothetical protein